MKKLKLISLICSLMMVIGCLSVFPAFAADETAYNYQGAGTAADPYILTNANFQDFMTQAATANAFKTTSFKLGENIVLNNGANDGVAADWANGKRPTTVLTQPIINYDYDAVFDGAGYSISGICMIAGDGVADVGLFKYLSYGTDGTCVKNLRLLNSYFESHATTDSTMGSIAARLYYNAQVTNCYSEAILTNTKAAEATSKADGVVIGGIVGAIGQVNPGASLYPTISNCVFAGAILNNIGNTGGILGNVPYNTVGGTGTAKVTISDCLNLGSVNSTVPNTNVSAILGSANWQNVTVTISKCMNLSTNVPNELLGNGNQQSVSVSDYYVVNGLRAKDNYVFPGNTSNWAQGKDLSDFLNNGIHSWTYKAGFVPNPTTHTDIPLSAIINADTLGLKSEGEIHSVRISNTNKGLRFITLVSDNGVALIDELKKVEGATVAMNTYITAAKYFTDAQYGITEFTKEALGADRYLVVPTPDYLLKNGVNGATVNAFAGSVVGINNLTMEYLAVGCVTVTVGDATYDIYASWNTDEATSVSTVATAAAEDVETEAGVEGYDNYITDITDAQVYSPYTQAQYDCIKSLIAAQ